MEVFAPPNNQQMSFSHINTNYCLAPISNICLDSKCLAQFVIPLAPICNLCLYLKYLSLNLKCLL